MKCGTCGGEFPDIPAIKAHKPTCPGIQTGADDTKTSGETVVNDQQGTTTATGLVPGTTDPLAEAMDKQRKLDTIHNYARSLGMEFVLVDSNAPNEPVIDVSHLPKDTLAGLHRGAELRFEVMGWLEKDRDVLHVNDVRYPRKGR